jgi:hypothetical protein
VNTVDAVGTRFIRLRPPAIEVEYARVGDTRIGVVKTVQSKTDVLEGELDPLVLLTLESLGPLHGCALAARLEQVSLRAPQLNMGTLIGAAVGTEQSHPWNVGNQRGETQSAFL